MLSNTLISSRMSFYRSLSSIKNGVKIPGQLKPFLNIKDKKIGNKNDLVIITGCDSGLGYNMAIKCHNLGMNVIACVLNTKSEGANSLLQNYGELRLNIIELDLKKSDSILKTHNSVQDLLNKNNNLSKSALLYHPLNYLIFFPTDLWAIINNAGVMTFGEFEWQTDQLITNQIETNLIGTMNFTHSFLPLARKYKSRIITVTSHCGLKALPGLATYSATKAGLRLWNDGLRIEMQKYGVSMVNFIPGSFHAYSNITANQQNQFNQMKAGFNDEQLKFYGDYFNRYANYLKVLSHKRAPKEIPEDDIMDSFSEALLDLNPRSVYKCEPFRYTIYHLLFQVTPVFIQDWLVQKFISMPRYEKKN